MIAARGGQGVRGVGEWSFLWRSQQKQGSFYFVYYRIREDMKTTYAYAKYHPGVNPSHPGFKTRPPHDVFPEDIECVFEGEQGKGAIFIGNLEAAESLETLKKLGIESILTACKNVHIRHPKEHVPYCLYIPGEDHENYDLSVHFDSAISFIHQSRRATNVLVHCMAGVSRSVTLVLAYLIKHYGMTYADAFRAVQRRRSKINPNPGFIRQLQRWEEKHGVDRSRHRHSSDHSAPPVKTKYDGFLKNKTSNLQDSENVLRYSSSKYRPVDYSKYTPAHLENSQLRNYNPEFDQSFYKTNSFNTTLKGTPYQSVSRNPSDTRLKEVLNTMPTPQKNEYPSPAHEYSSPIHRERSIENLSRDLDDRIAKIKQKYYQTTNGNNTSLYEPRRAERWDSSHIEEQKVNSFVGEGLARSRAGRESLRNSIYAPYNARTLTYQYA